MRFACILWIASTAWAAAPADLLRSLPLRFEPVDGRDYQWVARGSTYAVAFGARDTLIAAGDRRVRLTFDGSQGSPRFEATGALPTQYFRGCSPRYAAAYSHLKRRDVYPGIDMMYYANGGNLEFDFEIAPGADPS